MRTPHPTLTPQELAIMKVIWTRDTTTVRDVYEARTVAGLAARAPGVTPNSETKEQP